MFDLPPTSHFGRDVPKTQLLKQMGADAALRRRYAEQILSVTWSEKLAPETLNAAKGKNVEEIQIFTIETTTPDPDEKLLTRLDEAIPYQTLFLLKYEDKYCARIAYKETTNKRVAVRRVYKTSWAALEELPCRVVGIDLDAIYESFLRQIAGERLEPKENASIKEAVEKDKKREKIQKEIDALRKKIAKEKQINRQFELNSEVRLLEKQLKLLG